jgi:hypothetical protein
VRGGAAAAIHGRIHNRASLGEERNPAAQVTKGERIRDTSGARRGNTSCSRGAGAGASVWSKQVRAHMNK